MMPGVRLKCRGTGLPDGGKHCRALGLALSVGVEPARVPGSKAAADERGREQASSENRMFDKALRLFSRYREAAPVRDAGCFTWQEVRCGGSLR